ncbi:MAG TPA: hypothetical protein VH252_00130 [Chthoniobacterales bacterium]|jgi:hypothetical protein|nr:hypothetical protein [Chthoniobacterales bacterium]
MCAGRLVAGSRMDIGRIRTTTGTPAFALLVVLAILLASLFSSAPQWHARFHGNVHHECGATLFRAGNCELFVCDRLVLPQTRSHWPIHILPLTTVTVRDLDFSLLEHAPPAFS